MKTNDSAWGDKETQFFYELTPERVLDAVEKSTGLRCTGRAMALNSMENRVYEIEVETDDDVVEPSQKFRIAKFYRPGRWTAEQIRDEHKFLMDLVTDEIPAVAPLKYLDGDTLHKMEQVDIYYAVFPKIGGRAPDELTDEQIGRVGRLLARMHNVGALQTASHRVQLTPTTYGINNLRYLLDQNIIPMHVKDAYKQIVEMICQMCDPWFAAAESQRVHGDCHLGNLLDGRTGLFWVDFDDMVMGPKVQDLWLMIPGRDDYAKRQWDILLNAYESMGTFNRTSLRLVEPLRALRFVHFAAWIGKRWQDPAFPRAFPHYGTDRYWTEQLQDLREQLGLIQELG